MLAAWLLSLQVRTSQGVPACQRTVIVRNAALPTVVAPTVAAAVTPVFANAPIALAIAAQAAMLKLRQLSRVS